MRIGYSVDLHGSPTGPNPAPTWAGVRQEVLLAEKLGFDAVYVPDHLLYKGDDGSVGCWESVSFAAAIAANTSTIEIGHSMVNGPYRSAALVAKIAETLDEISGGRYILGLGAGNTPDSDYAAFGFASDHRYSRFAEAIEIIHGLLKDGSVDLDGHYHSAHEAELVLRGPRPQGPPIVIAAWGRKMMVLAARFADECNLFSEKPQTVETFRPMIEQLEETCVEVGRDPKKMRRSVDMLVNVAGDPAGAEGIPANMVTGSIEEIAGTMLDLQGLGVGEVHCYLGPRTIAARERLERAAELVELLHAA